jgi:hypothetical protein
MSNVRRRISLRRTLMQQNLRVVTHLPLSEIWDEHRHITAERLRYLAEEDLRQLVQAGTVRFAVANVAHPLRWISSGESQVFWKLEVRPHLVAEPNRPFDIYRFPEGYCYVASEWKAPNEVQSIVVLEQHH